MSLVLYNTLSRRKDSFQPVESPQVKIYTCGPTVFRFSHLGNLRSFLLADLLRRTLEYNGLKVLHLKNITDIAHEPFHVHPGEEDPLQIASRAGKITPQEVAEFYIESFQRDEARLNILPAHFSPRASQHIPEVISLIQSLLEKGYAYAMKNTVYFEVGKFNDYGQLSGKEIENLLAGGGGVEPDPQKRHHEDFTLWRPSLPDCPMCWSSPWGIGFPGWHIEDSAMAFKYLGEQIDIHTGGVDDIFPHHENVRSQCQAASGKPYARCWLHGNHLVISGNRMTPMAANVFNLQDLIARGFRPLAFRYLCLTAHYRNKLNFTWESLQAAENALSHLYDRVAEQSEPHHGPTPISPKGEELETAFLQAINDDLNTPLALAHLWQTLREDLPASEKRNLVWRFDQVLGLDLLKDRGGQLSQELQQLLDARQKAREAHDWDLADTLRKKLAEMGIEIQDTPQGSRHKLKQST